MYYLAEYSGEVEVQFSDFLDAYNIDDIMQECWEYDSDGFVEHILTHGFVRSEDPDRTDAEPPSRGWWTAALTQDFVDYGKEVGVMVRDSSDAGLVMFLKGVMLSLSPAQQQSLLKKLTAEALIPDDEEPEPPTPDNTPGILDPR
jgi:hypothetical protein